MGNRKHPGRENCPVKGASHRPGRGQDRGVWPQLRLNSTDELFPPPPGILQGSGMDRGDDFLLLGPPGKATSLKA